MAKEKRQVDRMWHRIAQRMRAIRNGRMNIARRTATKPMRLQKQRLVRLLTVPALLLTCMTFVYLMSQSMSIELTQLIESVAQPGVVQAVTAPDASAPVPTPTPVSAVMVMVTATPVPVVPTAMPVRIALAPASDRVARIQIPAIDVDSRIIEVGWDEVLNDAGTPELVWQVAKYAVGHHATSAAPGEHDNIVLSAHVGGYGRIFYRLNELQPNDDIRLFRDGLIYVYRVSESIYVNEASATESEQIANVSYINPTGSEMVTLITCWPPSGPDQFSQRLIVRAWPVEVTHE